MQQSDTDRLGAGLLATVGTDARAADHRVVRLLLPALLQVLAFGPRPPGGEAEQEDQQQRDEPAGEDFVEQRA